MKTQRKVLSSEQFERQVVAATHASAIFKLAIGVCNNATWLVMLDGHDKAKTMPNYRGAVKYAFKQAFLAWRDYERRLKYSQENRMFHVDDLTPEHREKYGDITDEQYYEYWQAVGYTAYTKTKPFITSLQNKYRLVLVNHKYPHADEVAWVMTAQAALDTCVSMFHSTMDVCVEEFGLMRMIVENVFAQFNLKDVAERWKRAMWKLAPGSDIQLDDIEDRNVSMGLKQLVDAWTDNTISLKSMFDTVDDYAEVFRTAGFAKREKREITKIIEQL